MACLTKEKAVFFVAALFCLWCLTKPRRGRDLAVLLLLPLLTAGWWYFVFSVSLRQILGFVINLDDAGAATWSQPWWFYFAKLRLDLGWIGLILAVIGFVAVLLAARVRVSTNCDPDRLWPLALLVPGYLLLGLMHGKVAWLNIALLSAFAAVQGVALDELGRRMKVAPVLPWLVAIVLLAVPAVGLNYERFLQGQDSGAWRGAHASFAAAAEINRRALPEQRVRITPMWYWMGVQNAPCPIFVYYARSFEFLLRSNQMDAAAAIQDIRQHGLNWMLLAPAPGEGEQKLLAPLIQDYGLKPIVTGEGMSCLFDVRAVRSTAAPSSAKHPKTIRRGPLE